MPVPDAADRSVHESQLASCGGCLKDRLERALERCSDRLQEISRQVSGSAGCCPPQTVREIFGDLVALSDEFEGVTIDASNQTLSVTTEPIVLEEIDLGPFEIRLHWDRIGERRPYEVVALEPNPAGESSDTTHPHVKGEQLCEGDGRAVDRPSPSSRTLVDFFQIVSRILDTYNSGSAYVSLSDWNGSPAPIAETLSARTTNTPAIAAATCSAANA